MSSPTAWAHDGDPVYDAVARRTAAAVVDGYSTSFGWACRLLHEPVRTQVRSVYALVRIADEVVDSRAGVANPSWAGDALTALQNETYEAIRSGRSTNLAVHAFALTARAAGIGPELLAPFFASMRTDLSVTAHDAKTFERYVYGSAEVVGLMCLKIFVSAPDARGISYDALSDGARRLGAAFQKGNFLRDLAEDRVERGRTYFPDLSTADLDDRRRDELLDDIDADLAAAARACRHLPPSSRTAVHAAHGLFAELSHRLRRTPAAVIRSRRVRVPAVSKAAVLATAVVRGRRR